MAGIPRPLYAVLNAAWWAATMAAGLTARARSRLRRRLMRGPRHGFGLRPEAVHITAGVHFLCADTDGRTTYLALRVDADNPVLITTRDELAAAVAAWTGAPPPRSRPHRAGIAPPHPTVPDAPPTAEPT